MDLEFMDMKEDNQFAQFSDIHNVRFNMFFSKPLKNNCSMNMMVVPLISANFEGDFINNSTSLFLDDITCNEPKPQMNALKLELGYRINMGSSWASFFNLGFIPISNIEILDANNDVYSFESDQTNSIGAGVIFNINQEQ